MTTVFHTTADELDESFLNSVKAAFKGRVSEIEAGQNIVTPDRVQFQ